MNCEPKDKSDIRSVAFNEVESSDSEPKDKSDTRSVAFNEVESSDQWIGKINPMVCVQATNYFSGGDDHNHNHDHVRDDARDHNHNRHCVRVLVFLKHLQFQIYCHKLQVKQVYRLHRQENM